MFRPCRQLVERWWGRRVDKTGDKLHDAKSFKSPPVRCCSEPPPLCCSQSLGWFKPNQIPTKLQHKRTKQQCTTFSSDWKYVRSSKRWWLWNEPAVGWHWWLWKEPVVMCGKWNVRQATLQQMFKVTTFCTDTCFQSFSPLINCVVHHALLKFSPCRNKMLPFSNSSV